MPDQDQQAASECPECGAHSPFGCAVLFERLLALDHSRAEPWGPLHGLAVACYRLQHHSTFVVGQEQTMLDMLRAYLDGGREALQRWVAVAQRANSHRRPAAGSDLGSSDAGPEHPDETQGGSSNSGFDVTIVEVAVDGTFPAEGYTDRVEAWARATLRAWHA